MPTRWATFRGASTSSLEFPRAQSAQDAHQYASCSFLLNPPFSHLSLTAVVATSLAFFTLFAAAAVSGLSE